MSQAKSTSGQFSVPYHKIKSDSEEGKSCCSVKMIFCSIIVVTVSMAVAFGAVAVVWRYPLHASCEVDWTANHDCDVIIRNYFVKQINHWKTNTNCKHGGQKCLYELVSQTSSDITATHETPKKHYMDDLSVHFSQDADVCRIHGKSRSRTWYAVLDYGTNFCNLHNLVIGSGLNRLEGYTENTSDSRCTQYTSADCNIY